METDIPGKQNTIRSASFDDVHVETACLLETQQDPAQYLYILGDDETPSTISRKDRKPTAAAVAASSLRAPKKTFGSLFTIPVKYIWKQMLFALDVDNLYPSMKHCDISTIVKPKIVAYYRPST